MLSFVSTALTTIWASGWSSGRPGPTGAGYGVRISRQSRDQYFDPSWTQIEIVLDGDVCVAVPLSPSFWRTCRELRSAAIGRWLLARGLAPWSAGDPPDLALRPVAGKPVHPRAVSPVAVWVLSVKTVRWTLTCRDPRGFELVTDRPYEATRMPGGARMGDRWVIDGSGKADTGRHGLAFPCGAMRPKAARSGSSTGGRGCARERNLCGCQLAFRGSGASVPQPSGAGSGRPSWTGGAARDDNTPHPRGYQAIRTS